MAAINFYLDKKLSDRPTYIIFSLSEQKNRIRISTGEKILPKYWDFRKQIVKRHYTGSVNLNLFLRTFSDEVQDIYREAKIQGIKADNKYIKRKLAELHGEVEEEEKMTFFPALDEFIENSQATRAPHTIRNYKSMRNYLLDFKRKKKYEITFETIDFSFRDKFHRYLLSTRKVSDSTVAKNFAVLKRFMAYTLELGYHNQTTFQQFKFREAPSTKVALTEEEVKALEELDLSQKPKLERVRDVFLFGCETSLRYSDIVSLKPTNIKIAEVEGEEIPYLELVAHKTRGEIQAPLSEKAQKLLAKYKDEEKKVCFPTFTGQKFNDYIKEIALLAGIDNEVEVIKFAGNKRIEETYPKYQLIGSHTARRTFVTLFFERGGSIASCMVYTGHKSYKELETYRKKSLNHRLKLARGN